jgi:D-tagatose-1,6-bisphosphate aldolase subunit GatZ/KbaZ
MRSTCLRNPKGGLQAVMEKVMQADPAEWQGHYSGDAAALYQQRHFGLADRIRYYWPHADPQAAVADLKQSFTNTITDASLTKIFSADILERAEMLNGTQVQRLIDAHIELALQPYFFEEI